MTTANKITIVRILLVPFFIVQVVYYASTGDEVYRWLALASFAVAVTFRMTDRLDIAFLPQGTHFLWHIFGGICSFFMIKYIYLAEDIEVKERQGRSLRRNHK